jgi:hypothetical protein
MIRALAPLTNVYRVLAVLILPLLDVVFVHKAHAQSSRTSVRLFVALNKAAQTVLKRQILLCVRQRLVRLLLGIAGLKMCLQDAM